MLAAVAFGMEDGFDLAGRVTGVPFTKNVQEWRKLCAFLYIAVDIVADCDKSDTMLPKDYIRVKSDL
jgi:hypothetical protein